MSTARASATEMLNGALRSPLAGVPDLAWNRLIDALMIDDDSGPGKGRPRPFTARTYAGGLGCFGLLPKRLVEINVLQEVFVRKGRTYAAKDKRLLAWLTNPIEQYKAVVTSLRRYDAALIAPLPEGVSRSGALALHHRLGPNALVKWSQHQEPSTIALFRRANGLF